jgi:hypothetical protein
MANRPDEEAPLLEADESEEGSEIIVQEERSWISNAPWWFISAGIHLVILLIATLVFIERHLAIEAGEVSLMVTAPRTNMIQELERPRDVFERKGIPKDEPGAPTEEPAIFFPEAKESDHNESADNEDYGQMKGDSKDFTSYIKGEAGGFRGRQAGKNPGVYDAMGVGGGGGGGGRYGGRFGGRENLVARGGGTRATESAVLAALKWLARHQNPDGSWGATSFSNQCVGQKCSGGGDPEYDAGLTGLSLLAFLGAGYSHLSKDEYPDPVTPGRTLKFGEVVKNGLKWIMSKQDPEGCVGGRGTKYMYNHTIAALALSEAYGMSATQLFKGPAQQAVDFIIAAQNPDRAWRYTKQSGDNDSSVTGWAIMALKSAELSELQVPTREAYEKARKWFDEVTDTTYYRVGYNAKSSGKVYVPGKNENFIHHESMTAVAVMCRIFMSKDKKDPALGGVQLLVKDLPDWKADLIDFYYWYYTSLALFQYDGPDGPYWKKWNEPMKNALVPNQKTGKDGCQNGSWTSEEDRWGFEGGRVYAVAINALTLEVYYRYANVFGGGGKK